MFWILIASLALAADVIPAADHLECGDVSGEMQCWPAQSDHALRDMCATKHGSDLDKALHVHVVPAKPTAMRESAPWSGQRQAQGTSPTEVEQPLAIAGGGQPPPRRQPATTVRVSARGGTYQQPSRRPSGVYVGSVYMRSSPPYAPGTYEPVYYGDQTDTFAASNAAGNDWNAMNDWVGGVRAENQAYENEAQEADERAQRAETARKAEEARRVAAQARAAELDTDLDSALDAGGELVRQNEELQRENARLRAAQENPKNPSED